MCFNVGVLWWLVISHLAIMMVTLVESCPINCICIWKSGKEWVECVNRGLIHLPEGAREETQVLDLSGNHLVILQGKCFQSLRLTNLQKLYVGRSNISQISQDAFVGLVGLVDLDLHENLISNIPMQTFAPCYGLMRLILNSNPLGILRKDSFKPLSQLTTLELSQCKLTSIEQGAFDGLHSLEWLRLDSNQLTYVPEMTLPLGGSLHGLTLHNNPWLCNCHLRALKSWLKESSLTAPQESEPYCQEPSRLYGKQIKKIKFDDLACLPQIKLDNQIEVDENSNVTVTCYVYAIPPATVTWYINGEKCGTQNENDSFIVSSISYLRYMCKQRGQFNMTNNLSIYGADKSDEGTFTCIAENTAGYVEANLSLRVRLLETSTVEPVSDNPKTGYIAVIAAGALIGTLMALGCVIASILFCIRRQKNEKRNSNKNLNVSNKVLSPLTKDIESIPNKIDSRNLDINNQQNVYGERDVVRTSSLDRRDTVNPYRNSTPKYLTEPDLINEVYPPSNQSINDSENYNLYQHQHQLSESRRRLDYPDTRYTLQNPTNKQRSTLSHLSYLDHDGYPLNFGLPKIPFNANCTLPRLRQRLPEDSAASPAARYSREAEFLARSNLYDSNVVPRSDARYTVDGYIYPAVSHQPILSPVRQPLQIPPIISPISPCSMTLTSGEVPFIPSPPAAYRSDTIPLSPRSLLSKTAQEAAAAVAARGESIRPPDHPESPDEGYVGDAMDV